MCIFDCATDSIVLVVNLARNIDAYLILFVFLTIMEISGEVKHLSESLKALNIKPKADTPHDLQQWLEDFSKTNTSASTSISVTSFRPKLSTFYGDVFI